MHDPSYPGWPRWAKVQLPFLALLLALVLGMSTGLAHHGGESMAAAGSHSSHGGRR